MSAALLIGPKLISFRNSLAGKSAIKKIPFVLITLLFWALLYIGSYKALSYVRGIDIFGEVMSRKIHSMMFFSLMGFLLLSNVITAISAMYLSRDLPLLRTLPVPEGDVMLLKTLETVLNSSWMVLSFMPPIFFAAGAVYGAPAVYYPAVFLLFMLLVLITGGAGIVIAHVLTYIFPAKGTRDFLWVAGFVLFMLVYFVFRSSVPVDVDNPVELIDRLMAFRGESPMLPSLWLTDSVMPLLQGKDVPLLYPLLLLSNAVFLLMVSMLAGGALYGRNLENMREGSGGRKTRAGFYPGNVYSVLYKDVKTFARDRAQWSQLMIIIALAFIYVYNFGSIPMDVLAGATPYYKELLLLVNVLMAGLVLSAVAARFLYSSVSLEGQAFWVIRAAPVDLRRFLFYKLLFGTVPVAVLTSGLVLVTDVMMGVPAGLVALSTLVVLMVSIATGGLGTGLGAMYPKFKYENIASVSMSLGGMAFMVAAFALSVATTGLLAWPVYLYIKNGYIDLTATLICALVAIAINTAAFLVPMRLGLGRLKEIIL